MAESPLPKQNGADKSISLRKPTKPVGPRPCVRNRSYLEICNQFLDHYGAPLTSRCVSVSAVFREPCPRPEGQNVPSTRSISAERPSTAADGRAASPDMERGIQYPCTVHHYVMLRVNMWSAMGSQSMGNFSICLCCLVRLGRQWSPLDIFLQG